MRKTIIKSRKYGLFSEKKSKKGQIEGIVFSLILLQLKTEKKSTVWVKGRDADLLISLVTFWRRK